MFLPSFNYPPNVVDWRFQLFIHNFSCTFDSLLYLATVNSHVTHYFDSIFILQHTKEYLSCSIYYWCLLALSFFQQKVTPDYNWPDIVLTLGHGFNILFLDRLKSFSMFYFYIASKLMFKTMKSNRLMFVKNAFANKGCSTKLYKINCRKKNFILNSHCRTVE